MKKKIALGIATFVLALVIAPVAARAVGPNGECSSCEKLKYQYAQAMNGGNDSIYAICMLYLMEFCPWNNGYIDSAPVPSYCSNL